MRLSTGSVWNDLGKTRSRIFASVTLLALCLSGAGVSAARAEATDSVQVQDPLLKACINGAISAERAPGANITQQEISGVTSLSCRSQKITSLVGLEYATGLVSLNLAGNAISDVSQLSGLTELEMLFLDDNHLVNVKPLAGMKKLIVLGLDRNKIIDLSSLNQVGSESMPVPPDDFRVGIHAWGQRVEIYESAKMVGLPNPVRGVDGKSIGSEGMPVDWIWPSVVGKNDFSWSNNGWGEPGPPPYQPGFSGVLSFTAVASKIPAFSDVSKSHKFYTDIDWMRWSGLSTGTADKDGSGKTSYVYGPSEKVSREAMAAFLFRSSGQKFTDPKVSPFADVKTTDKFFTEIAWMHASGLSTGTRQASGKPLYKPKDSVSREAMAAFLFRKFGWPGYSPLRKEFADVDSSNSRFFREISWMAYCDISTGTKQADGRRLYKPKDAVSREAMAAFLHRSMKRFLPN